MAVLLATFVPFYFAYRAYAASGGQALTYQLGMVSLRLDGLSLLLAFSVLVLGSLVALFSGQYLAGEESGKILRPFERHDRRHDRPGYANDLFNLWIWFETMAVASLYAGGFLPANSRGHWKLASDTW